MAGQISKRINIDEPRWDQNTFIGRLKHFANITDPRTVFASSKELDDAKELLQLYRLGKEPPGTTEQKLYYASKLYQSAFHPDSGEKQNFIGRMSFQVPGGMLITGFMLQFYRTTPAVVFWQWVNQSFNALVNYTNRNAESPISTTKMGIAYVSATTSAVLTAVGLKTLLQTRAPPIMQRLVPFAAVAAANCVNIPLMRQSEIIDGIAVYDENGNKVTESKLAAVKGISQVVLSRIIMAAPGMIMLPFIMEELEKYRWMKKIKPLHGPIQVLGVGVFLLAMVPVACSIFPQNCKVKMDSIKRWEPEKYKSIDGTYVYFNKGL